MDFINSVDFNFIFFIPFFDYEIFCFSIIKNLFFKILTQIS